MVDGELRLLGHLALKGFHAQDDEHDDGYSDHCFDGCADHCFDGLLDDRKDPW